MKRINYSLFAIVKRIVFFFLFVSVFGGFTATAQSFTVWDSTDLINDVPAGEGNDAAQAIEVGFKFMVNQVGTIRSISFYKYSCNGNSFTSESTLWSNGNTA